MNEWELEKELPKLQPAAASHELEARIVRALEAGAPAGQSSRTTPWLSPQRPANRGGMVLRWLERLLWTGLGAAAAVMLLAQKQDVPPVASQVAISAVTSDLQPVLTAEEDLGWRDEGVHFDESGRALLKVRRMAVQRQAWADLQHAGVVQTEAPRQEVMWIPVSVH